MIRSRRPYRRRAAPPSEQGMPVIGLLVMVAALLVFVVGPGVIVLALVHVR